MMYNERYTRFMKSDLNMSDYAFIDPPWNYPPTKYRSDFWQNLCFLDLFQTLKIPTLFVWVTLDQLPVMISGFVDSAYDLKALIPYARVNRHEDLASSIKNGFRNSLQYLAVFQSKKEFPIHILPKTVIIETENDLCSRPIQWEDEFFGELGRSQLKGIYLLPDGNVADTDVTGGIGETAVSKHELF